MQRETLGVPLFSGKRPCLELSSGPNSVAQAELDLTSLSILGPRRAFVHGVEFRGVGLDPGRVPAPAPIEENREALESLPEALQHKDGLMKRHVHI